MRDSSKTLAECLLLAALLAPLPALAGFQECLAGLRGEAADKGISAATFDAATRGLQPSDAASFLDKQPEFKTPIWDYLAGLVDEERVADGRERLRQFAGPLRAAEARFGVDPAVIVAVWGVETDYGRNMGKRPLVQSLATLSCEGRRQAYYRGEFFATLKIIQNGDIRPEALVGSWAGAFGHTQFMPSTFHRLAVDMEGHGRRDIVESIPDALGSTANYLKHAGWIPGMTWGFEVVLPAGYSGPSGRAHKFPMAHWASLGLRRVDGRPLGEGMAGLLLPAGPLGPAFLTTRNLDAIYGYNPAEAYALAIAHLSDRIKGGPPFHTPWPTDDPGLSRAEKKELQQLLIRRGYDVGEPNGAVGDKTHAAIVDYQTKAGLPADGNAGARVLRSLRAAR